MSAPESPPPLADYQRQAHEFIKAERWNAALQLLRRAIAHYPDSADLFSDLAAAERASGNLDAAIKFSQEALRLDPKLAFVHNNLGSALAERNDTREAIDCFHRALVLQPRYPAAINNLAAALIKESRLDEARKMLERLFAITRDHVPAFETLAALNERQGNTQEALKHYSSLAQHHLKENKPLDALRAMDACQRLGLRTAGLQTNRSAALLQLGRPAEAKTAAQLALQIDPNHANAHVNLAASFVAMGDNRSAIPCLKRATDLAPNLAAAFVRLGNAYAELGEFSEARRAQERALELAPDAPQALVGLAAALKAEGHDGEAMNLFRKALGLAPNFADAHTRYGNLLLQHGDVREGFKEREWRRFDPPLSNQLMRYAGTPYGGESLEGKRLVVCAEGDDSAVIQFVRFLPALKAAGAEITLDCSLSLFSLLRGQSFIDHLVSSADTDAPGDFFVPLLSLPYYAESTLDTLPSKVPYLELPQTPHLPAELQAGQPKIGLIWTRNTSNGTDARSSLTLGQLDVLGTQGGCTWYSLQVGAGREQITTAPRLMPQDLAPYLADLADAATVLSQLDLLITVDTTLAHLAGALGVPTWVLLPKNASWTWFRGREDSPWYPHTRLFRQQESGNWAPVIANLSSALGDWLSQRAAP